MIKKFGLRYAIAIFIVILWPGSPGGVQRREGATRNPVCNVYIHSDGSGKIYFRFLKDEQTEAFFILWDPIGVKILDSFSNGYFIASSDNLIVASINEHKCYCFETLKDTSKPGPAPPAAYNSMEGPYFGKVIMSNMEHFRARKHLFNGSTNTSSKPYVPLDTRWAGTNHYWIDSIRSDIHHAIGTGSSMD